MLAAAGQAFRELFTPPFRAVLLKCVGFTILLFALMIAVAVWGFGHFVDWSDRIETALQWLGGFALVVGSIFLIPPVSSLIAGLYIDDIAATVEKENFPADPPGRELPVGQSIVIALRFFLIVLAVNIVALVLLLVPGVNLIAFFAGNGYLLGREYFEMAAMRHLPAAEARALRKSNRLMVFAGGLIIAGLASVPILNLVTPLFATAFMVRVFKGLAARAGLRFAPHPA